MMKEKMRRFKPAAITFMILFMIICNFGTLTHYANSPGMNEQDPVAAKKNSLQEVAVEIEKDFGVKVIQEEEGLYCEIKSGEYVNDNYGFRVVVPEGLRGLTDVPPHPHHGFFIRLAQKNEARIWINATYNAAVYETLDEAVISELKASESIFPDFEVRQRKPTRLQDIPAARLLAQYRDKDSGIDMISEQIIALKKAGEEDLGIIYRLALETPPSRYKTDRKIFRQIINSWRIVSETVETEKERDK
jgi:hypothetical protein